MQFRSVIGFFLSLLFHLLLIIGIVWAVDNSEELEHTLNGVVVDNPNTTLSMEMVMAMVQHEETPPKIEPEPEKIEQPKEEIPDPTVVEKKKEPKPDEKQKIEPKKDKPKVPKKKERSKVKNKDKKVTTKANKTVKSSDQVNSNLSAGVKSSNQAVLGDGGVNVDSYRRQLRSEIERHKRYSQRAKMMRHQGRVIVSFTLNNDGSISNVSILQSSGSSELDKLAVQAVNSARSIGPRPAGMSSQVSVPIDFKLR